LTQELKLQYVYLGHGFHEGRKCVKDYSFDFRNKGHKGRIMYSTNVYSDPTYFPYRKSGEERVVSLSGASYMSGKEKLDQRYQFRQKSKNGEIWQELTDSQVHSENESVENRSIPNENQIVGYNAAQDQYALISAGEIKYVDSSELESTTTQMLLIKMN
jgi:hypothetical protein